jgi:glycosyltransferase involved in cell wall biosynthesis
MDEPMSGEPKAGGPTLGAPSLSVVVPVYNERLLVAALLERLLAAELPQISALEVLVVDDGSTDGTREIVREIAVREPAVRLVEHERNRGKGAAVRTGIREAGGDLVVFQDADLEYDPADLARLVEPFLDGEADVVYGSRFLAREKGRVLSFRHALGNRLLTWLSNWLTDLNLTDMETCYKMFRADLLKSIPIRSNDFAIEPEITAKVAKRGCRVVEVPISYRGRSYREGKKIGWRDGIKAVWAMLRFWLRNDLYAEDEHRSHVLHALAGARRYNRWMADAIRPRVGARVLEVGAGIGNVTHWLLPRDRYLATDTNPHYLTYLRNFATGKPYLEVRAADLSRPADFAAWTESFDTVVCLNVLAFLDDPVEALRTLHGTLAPGGRLLLYVPRGERLFSSLDEHLGHRRRYDRPTLEAELAAAGFELESIQDFNRWAVPGWWANGKLLRRRTFGRFQLRLYDLLVPVLRPLDRLAPWPGLGLIASARKAEWVALSISAARLQSE